MLERYGTYAAELLAALPVAQQSLEHAPDYSREEIAFLAEREEVVSLIDLLLRRTSIAFVGGVTGETLVEVATAAGVSNASDVALIAAQTDKGAMEALALRLKGATPAGTPKADPSAGKSGDPKPSSLADAINQHYRT